MGTTATLGLRYPEATDPADVALDMKELADDVDAAFAPDAWTTMSPLTASWTAVAGLTPAYYKDASGIVRFRGAVIGGASGSTAFTMPAGYRPSLSAWWPGVTQGGSVQFNVQSGGGLVIWALTSFSTFVDLGVIFYRVA